MGNKNKLNHLIRDLLIIAGSIVLAIFLSKSSIIETFTKLDGSLSIISSLIAGAFFTSIFTIAPATVALAEIGSNHHPLLVAFLGAIGAVTIDLLIASFVRKDLSKDLNSIKRFSLKWHFISLFHFGFLKWVAFISGLAIIASPLPDELGLLFIGISKVKAKYLPPLLFIANFFGIYTIISISQALSV